MMQAREAIAFLGALRGLSLAEGRKRADSLLEQHGLGDVAQRPIRTLSKGMAQTVQILGTIIHGPRLIVLDEPFSGLDALNQGRLEALIRAQVADGATVLFSTHVIAHAERLCERIAIIVGGRVRFEGSVDDARGRMRPAVTLVTRRADGSWREALPPDARHDGRGWSFELPEAGIEPLLARLIEGDAGIEALSIERLGLHDAFVDIVGASVASAMDQPETEQ
jgi:ABC-2 type transport system ATP-binding protein